MDAVERGRRRRAAAGLTARRGSRRHLLDGFPDRGAAVPGTCGRATRRRRAAAPRARLPRRPVTTALATACCHACRRGDRRGSGRHPAARGTRPNNKAVTMPSSAATASTGPSSSATRRTHAGQGHTGMSASRPRTPADPSAAPQAAPASPRMRLSTRRPRTSGPALAPRAVITATSRRRDAARTSSRFATLAQEMSKTSATPVRQTSRDGRTGPISNSAERCQCHPHAVVLFRVVAFQGLSDAGQLGRGLLRRPAGAPGVRWSRRSARRATCCGGRRRRQAVAVRLHRHPGSDAAGEAQSRTRRHHTDDGVGQAVGAGAGGRRFPGLGAELRLPQVVETDGSSTSPPWPILSSAVNSRPTSGVTPSSRNASGCLVARCAHDNRRAIREQTRVEECVGPDAYAAWSPATPVVLEVAQRHPPPRAGFLRVDALHAHERLGIGIRIRSQQQRIGRSRTQSSRRRCPGPA